MHKSDKLSLFLLKPNQCLWTSVCLYEIEMKPLIYFRSTMDTGQIINILENEEPV